MTKKEYLENLPISELVNLWNNYACDYYPDDYIYYMDEFNEIVTGNPWEIAKMCYYGSFAPYDRYFYYDGYGNIKTGDFLEGLPIDLDLLADDIELDEIIEIQRNYK